jgi:cytochrome c oxidase subunit 4
MTVFISQFILLLGIILVLLVVAGIAGSVTGSLVEKISSFLAVAPGEAEMRATAAARMPAKRVDKRLLAARQVAYRQGILVLIALAVLTVIEFILAKVTAGSPVLLFVVALVKAGLIVQYYMHLRHVWGEEETHQ